MKSLKYILDRKGLIINIINTIISGVNNIINDIDIINNKIKDSTISIDSKIGVLDSDIKQNSSDINDLNDKIIEVGNNTDNKINLIKQDISNAFDKITDNNLSIEQLKSDKQDVITDIDNIRTKANNSLQKGYPINTNEVIVGNVYKYYIQIDESSISFVDVRANKNISLNIDQLERLLSLIQ